MVGCDFGEERSDEVYFGLEQARRNLGSCLSGPLSLVSLINNKLTGIICGEGAYSYTPTAPILNYGDHTFPRFRKDDALIDVMFLLARGYMGYEN